MALAPYPLLADACIALNAADAGIPATICPETLGLLFSLDLAGRALLADRLGVSPIELRDAIAQVRADCRAMFAPAGGR